MARYRPPRDYSGIGALLETGAPLLQQRPVTNAFDDEPPVEPKAKRESGPRRQPPKYHRHRPSPHRATYG